MAELSRLEKPALVFIIPANIFYSIACITHAWFEIPPTSFYGLWWARFCDVLRCQLVPAFFTEEPSWYHLVQSISLIAWICIFLSLLLLITNKFNSFFPEKHTHQTRHSTVLTLCLISVFAISTSLILFYVKLKESSPEIDPEVSWSSLLAFISCICQLLASLVLLQTCDRLHFKI